MEADVNINKVEAIRSMIICRHLIDVEEWLPSPYSLHIWQDIDTQFICHVRLKKDNKSVDVWKLDQIPWTKEELELKLIYL